MAARVRVDAQRRPSHFGAAGDLGEGPELDQGVCNRPAVGVADVDGGSTLVKQQLEVVDLAEAGLTRRDFRLFLFALFLPPALPVHSSSSLTISENCLANTLVVTRNHIEPNINPIAAPATTCSIVWYPNSTLEYPTITAIGTVINESTEDDTSTPAFSPSRQPPPHRAESYPPSGACG